MLIEVTPLRAFRDNYIWCLGRGVHVAVVDPGDAAPVKEFLGRSAATLSAILVTHHHDDHTGGVEALAAEYNVPVFGPALESIPSRTHALRDGDHVVIPGLDAAFDILDVPGHTAGHIAYVGNGMLFCGDTLFSAGCGRLFEGTPAQMLASLDKLAALPPETLVFCTHEYTASNLRFAESADPANDAVRRRRDEAATAVAAGEPSLPSTIGAERTFNPFLRVDDPQVAEAASRHAGRHLTDRLAVFTALRTWKNVF